MRFENNTAATTVSRPDFPISAEVVPIFRVDPFGLVPIELTHTAGSLITGADGYAPALLIRQCRQCGQEVLRVCFARCAVWAETSCDRNPWIRVAMGFEDFMKFTGCDVLHACTQNTDLAVTQ